MSRDPEAPVRYRGMTLRIYRVSPEGVREALPVVGAVAERGGAVYPGCSCLRCQAPEPAPQREEVPMAPEPAPCTECDRLAEQGRAALLAGDKSRQVDVRVLQARHRDAEHESTAGLLSWHPQTPTAQRGSA